jgi:hypothetical protein
MIPYDLDPSLHDHEPGPPVLDDGFSPPERQPQHRPDGQAEEAAPALDRLPWAAR